MSSHSFQTEPGSRLYSSTIPPYGTNTERSPMIEIRERNSMVRPRALAGQGVAVSGPGVGVGLSGGHGSESTLGKMDTNMTAYKVIHTSKSININQRCHVCDNLSLTKAKRKFGLKKQIGLAEAVSVISGVIIGSGIFMTPGGILDDVGSVGASLVVWTACGVFAMFSTLSYMELGLIIDESGAEYPYCIRAYGDIVGFICAYGIALIAKPATYLLMLYTFSGYFLALFLDNPPQESIKQVTIIAIILITLINLMSVKLGSKITEIFFYSKLFVIAIIILTGLFNIYEGKTSNFKDPFVGTTTNLLAYSSAFYGGMWSFDGWNQLNFIVEELQNPKRDFPKAVWLSIPSVTVIYLLVNVAYLSVMTPAEIISSKAVAVTFAYRTLGTKLAWIVPLGVVFSTFGSTNGTVFTSARLTWVASRRSHLPKVLSYVDVYRMSPSVALVFNSVMAILMTVPDSSNFETVLDYFSFVQWLFYGLTSFTVLIFRYHHKKYKLVDRPYKVPIILPIISTIGSLYLVLAPVIKDGLELGWAGLLGWGTAILVLLSGLIVYLPMKYYNDLRPAKIMKFITVIIQRVMQVAPSEIMPDDI